MRRVSHFVVATIMVTMTTLASSAGKTMEETVNVTIQKTKKTGLVGRPRSAEQPLFNACLDTELFTLFISSAYDVNEVTACVENLSTGEYEVYSFDSSETAMLPISCSAGEWQVTLTLESGAEYVGEFQI